MSPDSEFSPISTVRTALDLLTVDDLKELLNLLPTDRKPARKTEFIAAIEEHLDGEKLRILWERLDQTQRLAVAETMYSPTAVFEAERFRVKYGKSPLFDKKENPRGYRKTPLPLRLFLYREGRYDYGTLTVPADLARRLGSFVPEPVAPCLAVRDQLPDHFERVDKQHKWQKGDSGLTIVTRGGVFMAPTKPTTIESSTHRVPLVCRATQQQALTDVGIVLRLIDLGKLTVSEKTFLPGTATLRDLAGALAGGDFYPPGKKSAHGAEEEIGAIKAFAWPLLVQAAGLAELHGKKLALTKAGRTALAKPAAEALRGLWQRWSKTKNFDEFNRIDAIKGQQGKGKRSMTSAANRRAVIVEALRQCPSGAWVGLDDFSRHMLAARYDFEITREPGSLYIGNSNYGSLGEPGYQSWSMLQKRYLSCLLFEYAATLGLIDVAYVEPWDVPVDYNNLWGMNEMSFLSRYDGLLWFRLNPLGAFCLGLADDYQPSALVVQTTLRVLPNQQIKVASGAFSTEENLVLEIWAAQEDDNCWWLDRNKILKAVENGRSVAELRDFLEARDSQGLPEPVEDFLANTARQASAFKNIGTVFLIECADAAVAELIAEHKLTKSLCQRAGPKHLTVATGSEERFRKAINGLGFGMPKV